MQSLDLPLPLRRLHGIGVIARCPCAYTRGRFHACIILDVMFLGVPIGPPIGFAIQLLLKKKKISSLVIYLFKHLLIQIPVDSST